MGLLKKVTSLYSTFKHEQGAVSVPIPKMGVWHYSAKKNSTAGHPVKKDKLDVNENSFYETLIILILFSTDLRGHDNYQCVEFS